MKDLFGNEYDPKRRRSRPRFDPSAARQAKAEAMDRVDANANAAWKQLMLLLVTQVARSKPRFNTDDVWERYWALPEEGRPTTHERRALGPVMLGAAKLGICRKFDGPFVQSVRTTRHAGPLQVWISLIY